MDRNAQRPQRVWIPPLPKGWEARHDHNQRRYFFINHQTKQTQWEDPRFSSRPTSSSSASSSSASNTRQSHAAHAKPKEHIPMRDMSPRHNTHTNRGSHHQEESSLTRELNTVVINNLHREFPKASKELIVDMYHLCHENERETREQLKDLGFRKDSSARQAQPQQHRQRPPEPPPPQPQPAPKPELSESQKRQLTNQLKAQFSKLETNVIEMALSTCDYCLEDTKRLLQAWEEKHSSGATIVSASTSNSGTSSSAAAPAVLEPAALPSESDNSPRTLTAGPSITQSSPSRSIAATTTSQAERGRNTVAGPSRSERIASGAQQLKASDVTKMSEHLLNTTSDLLNHLATSASCCASQDQSNDSHVEDQRKKSTKALRKKQTAVVTSQPMPGGHVTSPSHRTAAKGPDASLRRGPDSSLLITNYEPAQGPDRSLRQGPDHGRAFGPLGAKGSDPSLRCGPQSSLLQSHGVATLRPIETNI